jgi:hypothetical protein
MPRTQAETKSHMAAIQSKPDASALEELPSLEPQVQAAFDQSATRTSCPFLQRVRPISFQPETRQHYTAQVPRRWMACPTTILKLTATYSRMLHFKTQALFE